MNRAGWKRSARGRLETIGTRFGGLPAGLPALHVPAFRWRLLSGLMVPAMTVAMLGAIESLMSAMVADRMSGDRHDSNMELIARAREIHGSSHGLTLAAASKP